MLEPFAPHWLLLPPAVLLAWTTLVAAAGVAVQAADRNQPIALSPALAARIAREAAARAMLRVLGPFAFGRPSPKPVAWGPHPGPGSAPLRQAPVLLVPGLTWNRSSLWPLTVFLRRRGWRWVHAIDRASARGPLAVEAEAFGEEVRRLCVASGAEQVDVVAFSTGGLVAAWYLRHYGTARVRRLVTLGTAWRGTRMAVFGRGRATEEILYGSHVLDGLWPAPVPTVCVFSPDDPVVVPATSAAPPDNADLVQVEACGHVEMLVSARVFRAVQAALEQPGGRTSAQREGAAEHGSPTLVPPVPHTERRDEEFSSGDPAGAPRRDPAGRDPSPTSRAGGGSR
jgi:pimeloyl-ACP methyl ester carboxylesterase